MHGDFGEETMIYGDEPTERKKMLGFNKSTLVLRRKGGKTQKHQRYGNVVKDFLNCCCCYYYYFSYEILHGFHRSIHNAAQMLFRNYDV